VKEGRSNNETVFAIDLMYLMVHSVSQIQSTRGSCG
jgi:hypothetical protein